MVNNSVQEEHKEIAEKTQLLSELYQLRKDNEILKERLNQIKHLVLL